MRDSDQKQKHYIVENIYLILTYSSLIIDQYPDLLHA